MCVVEQRNRASAVKTGRVLTVLAVAAAFWLQVPSTFAAEEKPVNLAGFGFGVGIATNFDVKGARVGSATVVNNVVRIEDSSSNASVSFVLEAHYFLQDFIVRTRTDRNSCTPENPFWINCSEIAHGPFVAIEIGGGNAATTTAGPITGYAMGWMVGMRHPFQQPKSTSSWNLGLGLRVTPNSRVLGDGIVANQPLPAGETAIRYKTEPRLGVMLMSTFSF